MNKIDLQLKFVMTVKTFYSKKNPINIQGKPTQPYPSLQES